MIVFSAFLVAVAVALLIVGVVTSKLTLVYIAIGVSGVALLALGAGVLFRRREVFGESEAAKSEAAKSEASHPQPVPAPAYSEPAAYSGPAAYSESPAPPQAAAVPAGSGWPAAAAASGPPVAGFLPTQQPPARTDVFTPLPPAATAASSQVWEWRDDAPPAKPPAPEQAATDQRPPQDPKAPEDQTASEPDQPADDQPADDQPAEHPVASADSSEPAPAPPEADLQREVTVVPGVPRYHTARCILIRFMGEEDLDQMTVAAAKQAGCTPCRACLPDQPEKPSEP